MMIRHSGLVLCVHPVYTLSGQYRVYAIKKNIFCHPEISQTRSLWRASVTGDVCRRGHFEGNAWKRRSRC